MKQQIQVKTRCLHFKLYLSNFKVKTAALFDQLYLLYKFFCRIKKLEFDIKFPSILILLLFVAQKTQTTPEKMYYKKKNYKLSYTYLFSTCQVQ